MNFKKLLGYQVFETFASRRGNKTAFSAMFLLFPTMKVAGGATFIVAGGNPRPPPLNDGPAICFNFLQACLLLYLLCYFYPFLMV